MSARRARRELLDSERPPDRELRRPPRPTLRPARRGSRSGLDGDNGRGARDECRAARAVYVRRTPELGVRCSVGTCGRAALAVSLPLRQLRQTGQTLGHSIVCLTSVLFPLVVLNSLVILLNFESTDTFADYCNAIFYLVRALVGPDRRSIRSAGTASGYLMLTGARHSFSPQPLLTQHLNFSLLRANLFKLWNGHFHSAIHCMHYARLYSNKTKQIVTLYVHTHLLCTFWFYLLE